ncbi:MAG: hypothetical protein LRZ84_25585 [Desertifilum sp.]|nr:hypothetical protein [Desertifilum sp.]
MVTINLRAGIDDVVPSTDFPALTSGIDTLIVPPGSPSNDIINQFQTTQDIINISAFPGLDFSKLTISGSTNALIQSPGTFGSIRLNNVSAGSVSVNNFRVQGVPISLTPTPQTIPSSALTTGIGGVDTLVVESGAPRNDIINGFEANQDRIDLRAFPSLTFASLTISGTTNAVIQSPGTFGSIRLNNIASSAISASNFIFAGDPGGTAPLAPLPFQAEAFVANNSTPNNALIGRIQSPGTGITYTLTGGGAGAFTITTGGEIRRSTGTLPASGVVPLTVTATNANGTSSPSTINVFTRIEDAIADESLNDSINASFGQDSAGLNAIRVAPGQYDQVTLFEIPGRTGQGPTLLGPNNSLDTTWNARTSTNPANPAANRNPEAIIRNITLLSLTSPSLPGIQRGIAVDGFLIDGGRVDLFDSLSNPGTPRSNMRFENNIFQNNPSNDPTIQIESPPGGAVSNNIVIENNWFNGVGTRAPLQAIPQAIKLNNVSGQITIRGNRINDYGPGVQGFGILMQYGITATRTITDNTFERIGVAPVSILGNTTLPAGNTVI